jgi:hypothetical protein
MRRLVLGEHFLFLPALLFLTTSDSRARKFLKALAHSLSYSPRQDRRRAFVAGAAGIAWAPHRLFAEPCLTDLDGITGVRLRLRASRQQPDSLS